MFVLVTGAPASGKSTVSHALAPRLALPLLAKDAIKDTLTGVLGAADVEASRQLGRAAVAVLKQIAGGLPGAVIDSVWVDRSAALDWAEALPEPVVEVFCRCDRAVLEERYRRRALTTERGHFDLDRTAAELWAEQYLRPLAGRWQVIEADTSSELDLNRLVAKLRAEGP